MPRDHDRRIKIVHISPAAILNSFVVPVSENANTVLTRSRICNLPHDAVVVQVHYDYKTMMFAFLVTHPSFEQVPEGEFAPTLHSDIAVYPIRPCRCMSDSSILGQPKTVPTSDGKHELRDCGVPIAEQMRRYGITGWDHDDHAVWAPGCGPTDGTIIVRPGYIQDKMIQSGETLKLFESVSLPKSTGVKTGETLNVRIRTSIDGEIVDERIENVKVNVSEHHNPFEKTWRDREPLL